MNRWTCVLHSVDGRTDDDSYQEHIDALHDGTVITVMHWRACPDCGKPVDSFACKIRHIHLNSGAAKAARD